MSGETFSAILWCWHNLQTDAFQLRVVRVDTGEEVHLKDGSFLLRISMDADVPVLRCFVRHIASGREVHVQSGLRLREFVKACLLNSDEPDSSGPGTTNDLT